MRKTGCVTLKNTNLKQEYVSVITFLEQASGRLTFQVKKPFIMVSYKTVSMSRPIFLFSKGITAGQS